MNNFSKTLIFLCLSTVITSCMLFYPSPSKHLALANSTKPYDAIIVPGVPFDGKDWSPTMKMRSLWAKNLYDNGITKNIIYSGGSVYTKYCEAKILALYGEELGVPKENIFVEPMAEHSTENIYFSYQLAKKQGFKKIALATDPFQTNQTRSFIKKAKLPIDVIPVVLDTLVKIDHLNPTIQPETAIIDTFVSIKDKESFFKRFGGTLGKHIVWDSEDINSSHRKSKLRKKGLLKE